MIKTENNSKNHKHKHHDDEKNCTCNKDCKNCKTDQVFDIEKIIIALDKIKSQNQ
jgi:hypothetical protein